MSSNYDRYLAEVLDGKITGSDLAALVESGELTKAERRSITKKSKSGNACASASKSELSPRQLLRLEVKEKKRKPRERLSYEERRDKYSNVDELEKTRHKESANFVVCLGCRKRGHYLKDCPRRSQYMHLDDNDQQVQPNDNDNTMASNLICFNCGSPDHALRACDQKRSKDGSLPFATCFICKEKGHISRDCPNNANGLYPHGGNCHVCGSKDHLVKDCPDRTEEEKEAYIRKKEEEALGPRVKGLSMKEDDTGGGDDLVDVDYSNGNGEDSDDSDGERKKRKKKDKKKKKKRKLA